MKSRQLTLLYYIVFLLLYVGDLLFFEVSRVEFTQTLIVKLSIGAAYFSAFFWSGVYLTRRSNINQCSINCAFAYWVIVGGFATAGIVWVITDYDYKMILGHSIGFGILGFGLSILKTRKGAKKNGGANLTLRN